MPNPENLRPPYNSETSAYYGRLGGKKRSVKKTIANRLKGFLQVKNDFTAEEMVTAVAMSKSDEPESRFIKKWGKKIDITKESLAILDAENPREVRLGVDILFTEYYLDMLEYLQSLKKKGIIPSPYHRANFMNAVFQYIAVMHGLTPVNNLTLIQQNIQTQEGKIDFAELLRQATGDPDDIELATEPSLPAFISGRIGDAISEDEKRD